ncbi:MAG TPA: dihydroxy-acid dehydratase [Candidatus Alectryocaccomicrobium excrementavium]|uniref:Dihydroxy-acid dehydratase n=1 Tax=Candidatus Alectryocaccomicrobium excrementavium TaxID=2840668 RepID=A0A9D1G1M8_9FIRM|nr:dihydroxy-acid dehydratase [Candidatus Alectryocaccomicrobium excrementavium]
MKNNTSQSWKHPGNRQELLRSALLQAMGYTSADIEKPIIGILNTWGETNPGHLHFRNLAEAVKRGVWAAGGFPLEVNCLSICEVFFDVSSLIYRNLLAMETEELAARHPFDGIVLIGGCDKSVPAQLMAAATVNKPTIFLPGGAMLPGNYRGETLCCGTDTFKLYNRYISGELTWQQMMARAGCLYGSVGACPIMGTANTCQTAVEAMGLALPGSASSLGVSAEKARQAEMTGRRIVEMVAEDLTVDKILTPDSIRNAIRVIMACGGSTNLLIHLKAIMHRAGFDLDLMEFDAISNDTPLLVNVKPHGNHPVGEAFHHAGGVPAVMKELEGKLHLSCMTVTGRTVGENLQDAGFAYDRDVIRSLANPLMPTGGMCILKGNLAPNGAVIKRSAATERLLHHRGRAKVFDDLAAAEKWLADPASPVDEDMVVVLRGYGPKGAPGMPEFGNYLPVPPALHKKGIDDYLRITDSRMSGGCFGSIILHVSPEAQVGGPLAAVRDGDIIHVEADENLLEVELSEAEIASRLKDFVPREHADIQRGFLKNFIDHVQQADEGCDLDYLAGSF